jgi:hypothetical protein
MVPLSRSRPNNRDAEKTANGRRESIHMSETPKQPISDNSTTKSVSVEESETRRKTLFRKRDFLVGVTAVLLVVLVLTVLIIWRLLSSASEAETEVTHVLTKLARERWEVLASDCLLCAGSLKPTEGISRCKAVAVPGAFLLSNFRWKNELIQEPPNLTKSLILPRKRYVEL